MGDESDVGDSVATFSYSADDLGVPDVAVVESLFWDVIWGGGCVMGWFVEFGEVVASLGFVEEFPGDVAVCFDGADL